MDTHCRMIMNEFYELKESYEVMKDIVIKKIHEMLSENYMMVAVCEARVKEASSLEGKLELKGKKYGHITDITDILGARVVAFYSDHVDKISSMVESAFEVDWDESVDKRKMLASDQFGYMSVHYICRIPINVYYDPSHPEINSLRFEIQVRTILQHGWATAFHDTGYKSDIEVPKEYIRALNRLSGLLELCDEQFSTIMNSLQEYKRMVKGFVKDGKLDELGLDGDTFRNYLELGPFDHLNKKIAGVNRAEIQETNLMIYLPVLQKLGFETLADVEKLKENYSDDAFNLAVSRIGSTDIDIVASSIGVRNLCIVYALKKYGEGGLINIAEDIFGEGSMAENGMKRVVNQAKAINII